MPGKAPRPAIPAKPKSFTSAPRSKPTNVQGRVRAGPSRPQGRGVRDEGDNDGQGEAAQEQTPEEENNQEEGGEGEAAAEGEAEVAMLEQQQAGEEAPKKKKKPKKHPQALIKQIWSNYDPEYHGKITQILPDPVPTTTKLSTKPKLSENASESYKEACTRCERAVKMIIAECIALNQKYTDPHFDLERDLKLTRNRDCLNGLTGEDEYFPSDVKRVTDLYESPQFFKDGTGYDDVMQGGLGDCWMVSAMSILGCNEELLKKVCVIRDEEVGIYGFVFYRDGEWHPTIIDDQLYLKREAFEEGINNVLSGWGKDEELKYIELFQRGSKALYFARCRDDNETWVPLLEKAFAKAHGGYDALSGGQTGEAIEDFTGGVTTEIYSTNILNKDKFWKEELSKCGKEFMFDGTDAAFREWQGWDNQGEWETQMRDRRRKGIIARHAYAVLDTYEGYGERLVKVRNPWGGTEWNGDWSDGSSKWTAEWLQRVGHTFGDDGMFWMSYKDFLTHFRHLDRTRIFDDSWYTAQRWASMQVPFNNLDYQQTKFTITVPEDTQVVIVLSQLDDRYFAGLEGQYNYTLQFRVSMADDEEEYIARSRPNYELQRSTNVELFLAAGKYTVLVKIHADKLTYKDSPEDVIKNNLPHRKEKVATIGRLYDLAHQKGLPDPDESPEEKPKEEKEEEEDTDEDGDKKSEKAVAIQPIILDAGAEPKPIPVVIVAPPAEDSDDDDEEEDEKDPWNAACVVGLRVYSKLPNLSVGVVWPPKPTPEEESPTLDVDAITKAPQEEAEKAVEEEKKEDKEEGEKKENNEKAEEKTEEKKDVKRPAPASKPKAFAQRPKVPAKKIETSEEDEDDSEE